MTCTQTKTAKEDLQLYAEKLLSFEECDSIKSPDKEGEGSKDKSKPQVRIVSLNIFNFGFEYIFLFLKPYIFCEIPLL